MALIAAFGSVVLAGATYLFTKQRESEAELRREKLEHYKEFVASLSGVITGEGTPDGQRAFALACNKLNLIAPLAVVKALQGFQQEIKVSNTDRSRERHDKLMSDMFRAMREDLQVTPKDDDSTFLFGLWASGVPPKRNH